MSQVEDDAAIGMDRRQRLAAAQLLTAVDLPCPVTEWAQLGIEAAKICQPLYVGELVVGKRIDGLRAARALIDEMLAELTRGTECPLSPNGRHQVDTSYESGPYNCFHCEARMERTAGIEPT